MIAGRVLACLLLCPLAHVAALQCAANTYGAIQIHVVQYMCSYYTYVGSDPRPYPQCDAICNKFSPHGYCNPPSFQQVGTTAAVATGQLPYVRDATNSPCNNRDVYKFTYVGSKQTFTHFIKYISGKWVYHDTATCNDASYYLPTSPATSLTSIFAVAGAWLGTYDNMVPDNLQIDMLIVTPDQPVCTQCPAGTTSPSGSDAPEDCILQGCPVGQTGQDSQNCVSCAAGKYKNIVSFDACIDCEAGKYSTTVGATVASTCIGCEAGKYSTTIGATVASTCIDCEPGKFTLPGFVGCFSCWAGTYSTTVAAVSSNTCIGCQAGTYSTTVGASVGSTCIGCGAGTYSTTVGATVASTCADCEAGTYSTTVGATVASTCTSCGAGMYSTTVGATVASTCISCGAGKHSTTVGATEASTCTNCPAQLYSAATGSTVCSECPANSIPATDTAASSCICSAGYTLNTFGICSPCPIGTFKEMASNMSVSTHACVPSNGCCACGLNSTTLTTQNVNPAACLCMPGFAGPSCDPCAVGFYKEITGTEECQACPYGSTTVYSSTFAEEECVAAPGFFENVDGGFQQCPAGSFAPTTGLTVCDSCPLGATSPAASTSQSECNCSMVGWKTSVYPETSLCTCTPGYARNASGWCAPCPAGSFCTGGQATASVCTPDSTSPAGSTAAAACVCNAGYAASGGVPSTCQACAIGQYESAGSCQQCPASSSAAASDAISDCLCNAGYSGPNGQACTACAVGEYKQTPGSAECQACAALETTTGVASVSIDECVCAAGVGLFNGFCTTCASGTFKQHPGDQACGGVCPAFSSSPAGSSNLTDCRCDPGFSGPDGGTCVECAAGKYKVASGSTACTPCSPNSWHEQTAQASNVCVCNAGFTGEACSACDAGKYKATPGADACTSCPASSESLAGSDSPHDCLCVAGYELITYDQTTNAPECAACSQGKYKAESDNFACAPCPNHSTTMLVGSTNVSACICDAGYQPQASECYACPAGKYKADGSIACTDCPPNSNSASASTICECNAGYSLQGGACTACPAATYKPAAGSAACAACLANSTSLPSSTNVTACVCNAGFAGPSGGPCALCAAGKYALNSSCFQCPANSESAPPAAGLANCRCRAGAYGEPGGPCRLCAHGSYSEANELQCTACGTHFNTTAAGSSSFAACLCVPGHHLSSPYLCSPCPNNTYKATLSSDSCTPCTAHSAAPPASTSPDACACVHDFHKRAGNDTCARVCAAGFEAGGTDLSQCVGCRPGFYKTLEGDHACTPCPPNAFSDLVNQTSVGSCVCEHGFIWNATTQLCDSCPPGFFNNQANESQCFACVTVC